MPKVRQSADKWATRAAAAGRDYQQGVLTPRREWAQATQEAAPAYEAGIMDAIAQGRFAKGATAAAGQKLKQKASTLGVDRFRTGVAAAKDSYAAGVAPYTQVIEAINLPPRGRRGDPQNMQRAIDMAAALHQKKRERSGG